MKKIIPLIFSVFYITFSNGQAVGGWGNCEFATVATMNAFDPSTNAFDCKKVFVQATDEHYYWNGTIWVLVQDTDTDDQTLSLSSNTLSISEGNSVNLSGYLDNTDDQTATEVNISDTGGNFTATNVEDALAELANATDDNIYTTDGTIQANRTVDLDGNTLTFKGTNDVFIEETGRVGIGTNSPNEELEVVGDTEITQHLYVGPNASSSSTTTMRLRENYNTDATTYQLYSIPTITSPALTADRTSYGMYMRVLNNKTEDGSFDSDAVGGTFRTYISGTNTFRSMYGVQGYAYNQSTAGAGLGNLYGGYFSAYNNANTGTIPNAYASYNYVRTVNARDGDITNAYGSYNRVRVDSDDNGNITTGRAGYFLTDRRGGANLMTTAYGIQVDVNDAVTAYGLRIDADDADATTNYGIHVDSYNGTTNNYGIFGERGDWVLDHDGDGSAGGTGSGGDLILGEGQDFELYHDGTNSNIINNTGDLNITSSTTNDVHLSTNGGDVGIGTTSPDAKLDVENGTVRFSDYGTGTNSGTETYMLGVDTDGDVIEMNTAKSAKIFYPPAIAVTADAVDTDLTLDLHQQYVTLFGSPSVTSTGAPGAIPTYGETELYYYITDYDTEIFDNVSINANGVMEYDVKKVPTDNCSFFNVIFVVK